MIVFKKRDITDVIKILLLVKVIQLTEDGDDLEIEIG